MIFRWLPGSCRRAFAGRLAMTKKPKVKPVVRLNPSSYQPAKAEI